MLSMPSFVQMLGAFASVDSVESITALCRQHCDALGFDHFIYALRVPTRFSEARVVVVDGYPPAWLDRYWALEHHNHDPVVAHCGQRVVPAHWASLAVDPAGASAAMMRDAAGHGLRDGVSMPVHSPRGEMGILSLAIDQAPAASVPRCQWALPYVQVMAGHVHEATCRIFSLSDAPPQSTLTAREKQCLRWVADGKTSAEIALLLTMTERTVNFHLNNAMIKLDVSNRQHAVAKAILQGLVNPRPF